MLEESKKPPLQLHLENFFSAVRDPKSIADAVKRYMNDPVLTANIITNAKQLAAQKYDWNIIAQDMRILLNSLV